MLWNSNGQKKPQKLLSCLFLHDIQGFIWSCCFLLILNLKEDICEVGQKRVKSQWQNNVTQLCTKLICDML